MVDQGRKELKRSVSDVMWRDGGEQSKESKDQQ